jgi:hypothetical protein
MIPFSRTIDEALAIQVSSVNCADTLLVTQEKISATYNKVSKDISNRAYTKAAIFFTTALLPLTPLLDESVRNSPIAIGLTAVATLTAATGGIITLLRAHHEKKGLQDDKNSLNNRCQAKLNELNTAYPSSMLATDYVKEYIQKMIDSKFGPVKNPARAVDDYVSRTAQARMAAQIAAPPPLPVKRSAVNTNQPTAIAPTARKQ